MRFLALAIVFHCLEFRSEASGPPPVIAAQPSDTTVLLNDTATFSVEANSTTALTFQWRKGTTNISGATSSNFTFVVTNRNNAGSYSVKVVNGGGTIYSSNAILTVLSPPEISTQPASQTIILGQNLNLSVSCIGSDPLKYQWFFNDSALENSTNSILTSNSFQPVNAGNYFVVISNAYGSVTSSLATIVLQTWARNYNGSANDHDYLTSIALDTLGNIYATGYAKESKTGTYDYVTLKYDPDGKQIWRVVYDGGAGKDDNACAVTTDLAGNVYVTGWSELSSGSGGLDYLTIKYDANGNQVWASRFNGAVNREDRPSAIGIDKDGNVFVTGTSKKSGSEYQYQTVKYNSSGTQMWEDSYLGTGATQSAASSLTVDSNGNVYVTGSSKALLTGFDFATIKYSNTGTRLWVSRYSGDLLKDDNAAKVVVDGAGNVYVTGDSQALLGSVNFVTVKYNSAGQQQWAASYNGPANNTDIPVDLAVDNNGNVFVTGYSIVSASKADYATVKYNSTGQMVWVSRYDSSANDDDRPSAIALDAKGDVYLTGQSKMSSTGYDFATVKYNGNDGFQQWVTRYNSSSQNNDAATCIAVQNDLAIYVGGQANNKLDYTLIKYQLGVASPSIALPLQNQTVALGQTAIFQVVATGTGPLGYQWSRNGTVLLEATNSTLILSPVQMSFAGNYAVTVTNNYGTSPATSALLEVTHPPVTLSISNTPSGPQAGVSLALSVPQGAIYVIFSSSNGVSWTPIVTNIATSSVVVFKDTSAGNNTMRLFQAIVR